MFRYLAGQEQINIGDVGIPKVDASPATLDMILGTVYASAGIVCVIVIVIAGYMYTTSAGTPATTKKAKDAILYSLVGLLVVLVAFLITQFILGRF